MDPDLEDSFAFSRAHGAGEIADRHRYVFDVLGVARSAYRPVQGIRSQGVRFRAARSVGPVRIAFSAVTAHEDVVLRAADEVEVWFCRDLSAPEGVGLVEATGTCARHTEELSGGELVVGRAEG